MIDKRHRLRPERVNKYKANVFRDIKFLFVSVRNEIFCCGNKNRQKQQQQKHDERTADESTPLIN